MNVPQVIPGAPTPSGFVVEPPDVSRLITEDDTPLDNVFSEKQQRLLTEPLYASWEPGMDFIAAANVGLYFTPENSRLIVPDAMLSLGVRWPDDPLPKENRTYFVWKIGKVPDVVIEIVSNKEGGELSRKLKDYAAMKITNYVVYDPDGCLMAEGELRCYEIRGSRYEPLEENIILNAGLRIVKWRGEYEGVTADWIRWAKLDATLIPTGFERAESERRRADAEQNRANAAEARAQELEAKLKALGVEM